MLRAISILFVIIPLVLCNVIAAQQGTSYVIRTRFDTNLRAAPSLESDIVATALAGESLDVIGELDGWLRIGLGKKEVWMAGWVEHSVITKDGPYMITSRFADMSCERSIDWTEEADTLVFDLTDMGCTLTLRPHESVLPGHMREILVDGTITTVFKVNLALDAMKKRAPVWYAYVANVADKIIGYNIGSSLDVGSGQAYVYPHLKNIYVSSHAAGTVPGLIGVIVHESCHLYQARAGLQLSGADAEIMCHTIELYALKDMGLRTGLAEGSIRRFLIYSK